MSYNKSTLFDFHCHIDLHNAPKDLLSYLEYENIYCFGVTTLPQAFKQNVKWAQHSENIVIGIGLHPELIQDHSQNSALLFDLMVDSKYIGEVGLDGSSHHKSSWDKQISIFQSVLEICEATGPKIMSIHSRNAAKMVIDKIIEQTTVQQVLPILHWYSGDTSTLKRATEHGCYFSINLPMSKSTAGIANIKLIPINRILTETEDKFTNDGSNNDNKKS